MKEKSIKNTAERLLNQQATESEISFLNELGLQIKKPTKKDVLLAALYKKAFGGDMSAIKELLSVAEPKSTGASGGVVNILDDIGNQDFANSG